MAGSRPENHTPRFRRLESSGSSRGGAREDVTDKNVETMTALR